MFQALRKRIQVTPATVIASLALVFAMTGGAYAASKYLITSTKQISPKVVKALKGANGKNGANGANGATGPAGPTGGTGPQGPQGNPGNNGSNGAEGKSVTGVVATAGECPAGGEKYTSASGSVPVCNGQTGYTETLPSGKSEHGVWSAKYPKNEEAGIRYLPISFPIPLPVSLEESHVHIVGLEEPGGEHCAEGTRENPKAAPGYLCIYEYYLFGAAFGNGSGENSS